MTETVRQLADFFHFSLVISTLLGLPFLKKARLILVSLPLIRMHCLGKAYFSLYIVSRSTGQDMQRGPPRPEPSSEPAIGSTSIPAAARRSFVSALRS